MTGCWSYILAAAALLGVGTWTAGADPRSATAVGLAVFGSGVVLVYGLAYFGRSWRQRRQIERAIDIGWDDK